MRSTVRTQIFKIISLCFSVLKRHLLYKAQNLYLPTLYIVFKSRSLFRPLLKVAFSARQQPQTATNNSIICTFDGRIRICSKAFNLWSLKCAAIKTLPFSLAILSENDAESSKYDLRQRPEQLLLEKLRSKFHETETFQSLLSLDVANLCFSLLALSILASRLYRFPVLMAGSCYPSSFATELALYRLSEECLIRRAGTGSFFKLLYSRNESRCFPLNFCVLRELQFNRMLCSNVLRAIRSSSGFAVAQ